MHFDSSPNTVIVPWDLTDTFRPAIDRAFGMDPVPDCIHLLHVIRPSTDDGYQVLWDTLRRNRIATARVRDAFQREAELDQRLQQVRLSIQFGELAHTINQFARDVQASLIIMPPVRRSRLQRMLSVPVTDSIIRDAPCPVLVVEDLRHNPAQTASRTGRQSGQSTDPGHRDMAVSFGP